ncbi:hypothetical protein ABIE56_000423 [Luteibacter sp. 621]
MRGGRREGIFAASRRQSAGSAGTPIDCKGSRSASGNRSLPPANHAATASPSPPVPSSYQCASASARAPMARCARTHPSQNTSTCCRSENRATSPVSAFRTHHRFQPLAALTFVRSSVHPDSPSCRPSPCAVTAIIVSAKTQIYPSDVNCQCGVAGQSAAAALIAGCTAQPARVSVFGSARLQQPHRSRGRESAWTIRGRCAIPSKLAQTWASMAAHHPPSQRR